tara:strand:+ start:1288 stop:1890 length:603 start_codon:yes stop_codon:yes gene_type:complete
MQKQLIFKENFEEIRAWAVNPFPNGLTDTVTRTESQTIKQIRDSANKAEKKWGNSMIGQKSNGNWTTLLGEGIVHDVLCKRGENPRKPLRKGGYEPDWETDNYIYEVKTRNWTTSGTAGEKVPAVMFKYSDIPELYGKPLRIVCVAYQEWELTNGKTKVFGEVGERKRRFLNLAASMGITYVKFSDLANTDVTDISNNII